MQPDALSFISDLMRLPEPVLAADDINRLPVEFREAFAAIGMLQESTAATRIACECREHCCTVQSLSAPDKTPKFFIRCPDCGLVEIDSERLKQFSVSPAPVAAALAQSLASTSEQVIDGRLWRVGRRVLANRKRDVWLALGLDWDDGSHVFGKIARNPTPLVLVLGCVPKRMRKQSVVMLPSFANWHGGAIEVDWDAIEARLRADMAVPRMRSAPRRGRRIEDIEKLTAALRKHILSARDNLRANGELLPRPTQEALGTLAGIKAGPAALKSRVSRAFSDKTEAAIVLRRMYEMALDQEGVYQFR
jgi:hypothetical protein